jgi:hypothetical protein
MLIIGVVIVTTVLIRMREDPEEEIAAHNVVETGISMTAVCQSIKKRGTITTNIRMTVEGDGETKGKTIGHVIVQLVGGNGIGE